MEKYCGQEEVAQAPLYVNRELSWLEFNQRVLVQALNPAVPLLERLRFEAIYFSNLDEFFMVRVGSLSDQNDMEPEKRDDKTGMTAAEQISAIFEKVRSLEPIAQRAYQSLLAQLRLHEVDILEFNGMSKVEELIAYRRFQEDIKPLLSPQIVDRHHPFPFLKNKEQYIVTVFEGKNGIKVGVVPVSHLPAYLVFNIENRKKVVFTAELVARYVQKLYSKQRIVEKHVLRVTRNADISVDEALYDYDVDFRGVMQEMLKKRKRLCAVRVQLSHPPSEALGDYLCEKLAVLPETISISSLPMDFSFGFTLAQQLDLQDKKLCYKEVKPVQAVDFSNGGALRTVSERDLLLAYPFHSMKPFVDLLHEAAEDPSVISIKISLYRLANHSKVAAALIRAAEKGKEVLCVLELRARFDEQSNIDYAKSLEDAGCTVIYGLSDYKIHAKLCLITRKLHNKISYITQIGTGNYNEKTAEQYTDLCLITGEEAVGTDANDVFTALCMGEVVERTRCLWVAPNCFKGNLMALIDDEIIRQQEHKDAYICIKVNSLNDMEVMQKLIQASQAGVCIELFVRGICCLCPGIPGYTENITVCSLVGRYLEHSRIFVFGRGERQRIFLGSGDLLNRNTRRRVEVFVPLRSQHTRRAIQYMLDAIRNDTFNAWKMQPDGSYERRLPEGAQPTWDSQMELHNYFANQTLTQTKKRRGIFSGFLHRFHS